MGKGKDKKEKEAPQTEVVMLDGGAQQSGKPAQTNSDEVVAAAATVAAASLFAPVVIAGGYPVAAMTPVGPVVATGPVVTPAGVYVGGGPVVYATATPEDCERAAAEMGNAAESVFKNLGDAFTSSKKKEAKGEAVDQDGFQKVVDGVDESFDKLKKFGGKTGDRISGFFSKKKEDTGEEVTEETVVVTSEAMPPSEGTPAPQEGLTYGVPEPKKQVVDAGTLPSTGAGAADPVTEPETAFAPGEAKEAGNPDAASKASEPIPKPKDMKVAPVKDDTPNPELTEEIVKTAGVEEKELKEKIPYTEGDYQEPLKTGWLVKQGIKRKNWKKRFFVLDSYGYTFWYFAKIDDTRPRGVIFIDNTTEIVDESGNSIVGEFGFSISGSEFQKRKYYLKCPDKEALESWVTILREAATMAKVADENNDIIFRAFQYFASKYKGPNLPGTPTVKRFAGTKAFNFVFPGCYGLTDGFWEYYDTKNTKRSVVLGVSSGTGAIIGASIGGGICVSLGPVAFVGGIVGGAIGSAIGTKIARKAVKLPPEMKYHKDRLQNLEVEKEKEVAASGEFPDESIMEKMESFYKVTVNQVKDEFQIGEGKEPKEPKEPEEKTEENVEKEAENVEKEATDGDKEEQ